MPSSNKSTRMNSRASPTSERKLCLKSQPGSIRLNEHVNHTHRHSVTQIILQYISTLSQIRRPRVQFSFTAVYSCITPCIPNIGLIQWISRQASTVTWLQCYKKLLDCNPIRKECSPEPQKQGSERTTLNQIDDKDDCTTVRIPIWPS